MCLLHSSVRFPTDQNGNLNIFLIIEKGEREKSIFFIGKYESKRPQPATTHPHHHHSYNMLFTSLDHEIHFNTISFYFLFHLMLQYDLFTFYFCQRRRETFFQKKNNENIILGWLMYNLIVHLRPNCLNWSAVQKPRGKKRSRTNRNKLEVYYSP